MNSIKPYITLLKLRYQLVFIEVIAGVVFVSPVITIQLIASLVLLFLASHVFLYGGLYTINDLRDIEEDRKNEHKRHRPLPSGRVTKQTAFFYALLLIGTGLLLGYVYFPLSIFFIMILLIVLNILYTFVLKHIPFIELFGNVITHPPRLIMGVILAGGTLSYPLLFSFFCFLLGMTINRREIIKASKGSEYRANMKYYTKHRLIMLEVIAFIFMLIPMSFDEPVYIHWYLLLASLYVVFVFGAHFSLHIRTFWKIIYLK